MSDCVLVQNTTISARDGFALAATVFAPLSRPKGSVLVNSATAVPRKIYRGFASYLAEQGFAALTYDYRGTGESRPASLKGFPARMRDWAAYDVAGAIDHMRQVWPNLPLSAVGHSFGGHAMGLVPNNGELSRVLLVASQAAYWRLHSGFEKYRVYALLAAVTPLAHVLGYVPGQRLGLGEDLPKEVFLEWSRWCRMRRYFFDDPTLDLLENFPRFRGKLCAVGLDDDPWATPRGIDLLAAGFSGAQCERRHVHPRDVGVRRIGHFGYFRPEHRATLWKEAADWLSG